MQKVMVLAVHPDDETLGCGGTIVKHLQAGDEVSWIIMTEGKEEDGWTKKQIRSRIAEIEKVKTLGQKFGVIPKDEMKAHLDIKRIPLRESAITLHDGKVPLRLAGTGTQRLLAIALQMDTVEQGGISLIDEIEYGLEPHRICQLLRLLMYYNGQIECVMEPGKKCDVCKNCLSLDWKK